jgi:hypothetical protein
VDIAKLCERERNAGSNWPETARVIADLGARLPEPPTLGR